MTDPTGRIEGLREEIHDEQVGEVQKAAERTARRATRRMLVRWAPPIAASVALTVASLTAVALGPLYSQQNQTTTALAEVRKLAEGAKTAGELANTQLKDRGQATVPIPQPSDNSNSDVLVASATARVLASLPGTRPTTAQLGEAVARYVASNPSAVGPSPQQIAASLAGYLATNPPPTGPAGPSGQPGKDGATGSTGAKGDPGKDGHTPTTDEIETAIGQYLHDHPDALCPRGGTFSQLRVRLSDGGTADTWQCVVSVTQPPATTSSSPPPPLVPVPTQ